MKIGVIGLGSMGMRHAKNLQELGHTILGHDPARDRALGTATYSMANAIKDSDAVVIASPTRFHFDHAVIVGEAGKPAFIEKPISDQVRFGYYLTNMVGYNLRFHGSVKTAKAWIDGGRIGKPIWANFICGQYSSKTDYVRDGVILNWSHEIDLALYLLGDGHVEASSTRVIDGHDDMTDILLTHESGCRTTIHLDYATKPEVRTFTIVGTEGKISVSLLQRNAFLARHDRDQSDWQHCRGSYDQDYKDEMAAFIDRINGKETLGCTGAEALKVLDICLQVRRQAGMTS